MSNIGLLTIGQVLLSLFYRKGNQGPSRLKISSEATRVVTSKRIFDNKCELRVGWSVGLSTVKNGVFRLELVLLSLL